MKKRGLLTSLLVIFMGMVNYLQNGGLDHLAGGYGVIDEDTITRETFEIVPGVDRNTFCHGLHKVESKNKNYLAYNPSTSALGRYQFVPKYFREDIQEITNANTYSDFLNTPTKQEAFMDRYIDSTLIPGVTKVENAVDASLFEDHEILALVHFLGANGTIEYITTNQMNEKQRVGNIDASRYLEIVNKAMEAYN